MTHPSGIQFPFSFSSLGGVSSVDGAKKVMSNLKALITCELGGRLIRKGIGVESHAKVFRNLSPGQINFLSAMMNEAILKFEPRATNVKISTEKIDDALGSRLVVRTSFIFKSTGEPATLEIEI